jgi:ferritin-like metal-binding protein YciE
VFKLFGWNPQAKKCDAMQGLIEEGESILEETEEPRSKRGFSVGDLFMVVDFLRYY